MNRYEIFMVAFALAIAIVFAIKSKYFDRFINWLLTGTNSTTVADIKEDKVRLEKTKAGLKKNLDKQAQSVNTQREQLNNL